MTEADNIREELNTQVEAEFTEDSAESENNNAEDSKAEDISAQSNGCDSTAAEDTGIINKPRRSGWFKMVLAFAAGFAVCLGVFAGVIYGAGLGRIIPKADYDYYEDLSSKYGKFYVIMQMAGEDPLVKEAPEEITDEAIKEMISKLDDPYAAYFTKEEYEAFSKPFEAGYVGVGIMVEQTAEGIYVVQVFEGGPAESAGMQPGDQIVRVDGTEPTDIDDAVSRMMGDDGTRVTVTVLRDGTEIDLKMTRAEINMPSVSHSVVEENPDIGYIALTVFADDTDDEFKEAVEALRKEGCDKFILDLRDNGGGLTNVSIDIADYLLPECMIMTEINKGGEKTEYKSDADAADLDMVVLVNENTASASEILTAAIKENDAGTIIGSTTFGKGVTQLSRMFKDGTAIKMTVTEYLTPDGNHVQDKGIEPDITASEEDIMDKAIEELNN